MNGINANMLTMASAVFTIGAKKVVDGVKAGTQKVTNAAKSAGAFLASSSAQHRALNNFGNAVTTSYRSMNNSLDKAVTILDKGYDTIRKTPIAPLANFQGDSHPIKNYHAQVFQKGEWFSRKVGHVFANFIHSIGNVFKLPGLLTRSRILTNLGTILQDSLAIVVGAIFRGATLALSLIAHALPYLAIAATVTAAVIGVAVLGTVSPLAAVALVLGAVSVGLGATNVLQGRKIEQFDQKIKDLREHEDVVIKEIEMPLHRIEKRAVQDKEHPEQPVEISKTIQDEEHPEQPVGISKTKIALLTAATIATVAGAGYGIYQYGDLEAASSILSYAQEKAVQTVSQGSSILSYAQEKAVQAVNQGSSSINAVYHSTASVCSNIAQTVKNLSLNFTIPASLVE